MKKVKTIVLVPLQWHDTPNGNTYYTAAAIINGELSFTICFDYGYDSQYEFECFKEMKKLGILKDITHYAHGGIEAPWTYCENHGIKYTRMPIINVKNKGELIRWKME